MSTPPRGAQHVGNGSQYQSAEFYALAKCKHAARQTVDRTLPKKGEKWGTILHNAITYFHYLKLLAPFLDLPKKNGEQNIPLPKLVSCKLETSVMWYVKRDWYWENPWSIYIETVSRGFKPPTTFSKNHRRPKRPPEKMGTKASWRKFLYHNAKTLQKV